MSGLANHTAQELAEMLDSALGFVHQKDALTELVHRAEERDQFKRYHDEIREEYMEAEAERDRITAQEAKLADVLASVQAERDRLREALDWIEAEPEDALKVQGRARAALAALEEK
jgi:uncharacterized protein (DUF3084 family)